MLWRWMEREVRCGRSKQAAGHSSIRKGVCVCVWGVIEAAWHQLRDGQIGHAAGHRVWVGSGQHQWHQVTGSQLQM